LTAETAAAAATATAAAAAVTPPAITTTTTNDLLTGLVAQADVDRALFNSLRLRFSLGLFDPVDDQPYWKIGLDQVATPAAV
jgi:hypothetical protein